MGTEFELQGMDELLSRLQQVSTNAFRVERDAIKAGAEPIAEEMRSLVHVSDIEHEHIRDDIEISTVKTKDGVRFVEVGPGNTTNWRAKFLEWGTSKMQAIPFVQPAYEHKISDSLEEMKRIIREALRE